MSSNEEKTVLKLVTWNGTDKIHFVDGNGDRVNPDDVGIMTNKRWRSNSKVVCENFKFVDDGFDMDDVDYRFKYYVFLCLDDNTHYMFTGRYDSWEGVDWNDYDVIDVEQKQVTKWMPAQVA